MAINNKTNFCTAKVEEKNSSRASQRNKKYGTISKKIIAQPRAEKKNIHAKESCLTKHRIRSLSIPGLSHSRRGFLERLKGFSDPKAIF